MLGVRTFSAWARAGALLAVLLTAAPSAGSEHSELERRMITRALGPDPELSQAPQGLVIEGIQIVRLKVFDDDDPVPDFVNVFHAQTRERVIRRELLFREGEAYDSERVDETLRVLQSIVQFGVVVIVAVPGSEPGSVFVVVIVRDVWSLRANYQLDGSLQNFDYFLLNLSEDNLLGTLTRVGGVFTFQPDRYSLGGLLAHPRILGSRVDGLLSVGVFTNRDSGEQEGSYGSLYVHQPLTSLQQTWGFLTGVSWTVEQTRVFQGGRQVTWSDAAAPQSGATIPVEYATRIVRAGAQVTRAFGREPRNLLSVGVELNQRSFSAKRRAQDTEEAFAAFVRAELPVSDTRASPFVQLEHRTSRFLRTRDVETLALDEQFWLGQQAGLRVYPALEGAGSSRSLLGTASWAGYTLPLGNGFARAVAGSSVEYERRGRHQASLQGALRVVSPRLSFFRAVIDYAAVATHENYLNRKVTLGGESRPRGYVSGIFRGGSGYAGSLELRTSAINVLSARVGAVAFYDVGGAGDSIGQARPYQSAGAGLRILFPQVNRQVFRLDWAAPFSAGRQRVPNSTLPGAVYFSFGQAFELPQLELPTLLGAADTVLQKTQ